MVVESTERNQIVALEALSNEYKRNRMKHVEQMIATKSGSFNQTC